jgi:hypothetical protein
MTKERDHTIDILRAVLIVWVFDAYFSTYGTGIFMGLYLAHAAVLWTIAQLVQRLKKGKALPIMAGVILGG